MTTATVYLDTSFRTSGLGEDGFLTSQKVAALLKGQEWTVHQAVYNHFSNTSYLGTHFWGCNVEELAQFLPTIGVSVEWFDGQADD